ncbi:hypothetical protein [Oceanobacillus salinisoli]|uniref:hypothetical protein n=1 Tax=Oceanobacillus salinisoli TaxID=2678611 RepID=UPI0012E121E0|nr:hypothetical protein [Oceanobacillus salinisoli]
MNKLETFRRAKFQYPKLQRPSCFPCFLKRRYDLLREWNGKRLPTEVEWEYVTGGELVQKRYSCRENYILKASICAVSGKVNFKCKSHVTGQVEGF